MASYVFKIKHGDVVRRFTVQPSVPGGGPDMNFSQLEDTIRQAFKLPASSDLVINYNDKDGDVVTMAGDHDLYDACVIQELNPLRLTVTAHESYPGHHGGRWEHKHGHRHGRPHSYTELKVPDLKDFFSNTMKMSVDAVQQTMDYTQQILQACEPLIKGAPSAVVSEVMEAITKVAASAQSGAAKGATSSLPKPNSENFPNFASGCQAPDHAAPGQNCDKDHVSPAPAQYAKAAVHHVGVQCDVCGMVPIVGSRYKSNKKHDYDLCQQCFQECGKIEDYTQIERPIWRPNFLNPQFGRGRMRCPAFFPHGGRPFFNGRGPHMHGPDAFHGFHGSHGHRSDLRCGGAFGPVGGKLDARFVQDVTIFDGTEFAPGTAFTKIWRLRNSGSCAWPKSTKLIHVGGDDLGFVLPVDLELPEEGLAPDGEAEVSVDFIAPQKAGRYVSHWRLVSPTGQKFGHRFWVLIHVVPKDEQSPQVMESLMASSQSSEEDAFMMDPEAVEGAQIPATITPKSTENDVDGDATVQKVGAENVHVPELETTGNKLELEKEVEVAPGTLRYPEISLESLVVDSEMTDAGKAKVEGTSVEDGEFFMVNSATITEIPVQEPDSEMTANPGVVTLDDEAADSGKEEMVMIAGAESESNAVDALLETLDSMGFKQRDFNQMLLKKNEYDLQRTLDDLVMAAERESLLEELEEMGFYDTNLNRQLMLKHNGSVKRVVKELVQMYKDPKGKQQV
ncbi:protein NBR1 homolog [Physcomitrium patens]|uniref:ZZ-type domain-containing protein n=1 Tax=Physcomitrium patens TaxID=3218 RepID=A9SHX9_PHYPA|nr:protein NBR1 homolog [Physcomitrium patens]PNR45347.1 hypothetical protein PHYPA_015118 [Physcomitrium patens]|eukprot:XP_024388453.1 protein NBR1 homolog [Physcomitrella patens]